jgi:hypothetical protein
MYGTKVAIAGGGALPVAGFMIDAPAWVLAAVTVTFAAIALVSLVRPGGKVRP